MVITLGAERSYYRGVFEDTADLLVARTVEAPFDPLAQLREVKWFINISQLFAERTVYQVKTRPIYGLYGLAAYGQRITRPEVFDTVEHDVHRRVQEIGNGDRDVCREQTAVLEPFKQIDADGNAGPFAAAGIIGVAAACIAERITEYGYLTGVFSVPVKRRLDAEKVVLKPAAVSENLGCFIFAYEGKFFTLPCATGQKKCQRKSSRPGTHSRPGYDRQYRLSEIRQRYMLILHSLSR